MKTNKVIEALKYSKKVLSFNYGVNRFDALEKIDSALAILGSKQDKTVKGEGYTLNRIALEKMFKNGWALLYVTPEGEIEYAHYDPLKLKQISQFFKMAKKINKDLK